NESIKMSNEKCSFTVGEKFSSFEDLLNKIEKFKEDHSTELSIAASRKLESAVNTKRLSKDKNINKSLIYFEIKYICIEGGKCKSRSKGARKTSTLKKECPLFISLGTDKDAQSLVVKNVNLEHNHEVNRNLFRHYAPQRKLSGKIKEDAIGLLKAKANKKLVRLELAKKTGKIVTMRDVHNLNKLSKDVDKTRNDLQSVVNILKNEFGCSVNLHKDNEDNFLGLFFQDESMKVNFDRFPEILFVDATYKVNELRIPAYIFLVEDSLGQSEVVGVALMVNETKENLAWLIGTFAEENPTKKLRVVMADKDINERNRISELLGVPILICLYHALKIFKRELSTLSLTPNIKDAAKGLFESMCYAYTKSDFERFEKEFQTLESSALLEYYDKNWKPISKEWVKCFKAEAGDFLNSTNNRLESFNSKLKTVVDNHCSLEEFVRGFFVVLDALRTERDANVAKEFQKLKLSLPHDPCVKSIYDHLTSYSANFVCEQLAAIEKTTVRNSTINSCDCCFYLSMDLPCRHIFLSRSLSGCVPLFDPVLCAVRWSKTYYRQSQRLFTQTINKFDKLTTTSSSFRPLKALNFNERYRKADAVCKNISMLASEPGGTEFVERMTLLRTLEDMWRNGQEVHLLSLPLKSTENENPFSSFSQDHCQGHKDNTSDKTLPKVPKIQPGNPNVTGVINNSPLKSTENENPFSSISSNHCQGHIDNTSDKDSPKVTKIQPEVNHNLPASANEVSLKESFHNQSDKHIDIQDFDVSNVKLPPRKKPRGRPKGHNLTVIGRQKKRKLNNGRKDNTNNKALPKVPKIQPENPNVTGVINNSPLKSTENENPVSSFSQDHCQGHIDNTSDKNLPKVTKIQPENPNVADVTNNHPDRLVDHLSFICDPSQRAVIEVPGDGHCLLYAWEICLNFSENSSLKPSYVALSSMVMQQYLLRKKEYKKFLCDNELNVDMDNEIRKYLNEKSYGRQIGDEPIFDSLTNATNVKVFTWESAENGSLIQIGHRVPSDNNWSNGTIHLHKMGQHYEPIVAKKFQEMAKSLSRSHGISMQETQRMSEAYILKMVDNEIPSTSGHCSIEGKDSQIQTEKRQKTTSNAESDYFNQSYNSLDDQTLLQHVEGIDEVVAALEER
uniref:OTU domain-containing protein n=2 Tax=Clytia hemisphaerica TaxID=252671 RepID=A0A7M5VF39_9CNID